MDPPCHQVRKDHDHRGTTRGGAETWGIPGSSVDLVGCAWVHSMALHGMARHLGSERMTERTCNGRETWGVWQTCARLPWWRQCHHHRLLRLVPGTGKSLPRKRGEEKTLTPTNALPMLTGASASAGDFPLALDQVTVCAGAILPTLPILPFNHCQTSFGIKRSSRVGNSRRNDASR